MAGIEDRLGSRNGISPDMLTPRVDTTLKETTFDGITYTCPTWEQMRQFNLDLVKQILQSGPSFDRVIALSRGGLTWSRTFADGLRVPEISTIRIRTYEGIGQVGKPIITQPLRDKIKGETVIVLDEVTETGVTLAVAIPHIKRRRPKEMRTATFCYKPDSNQSSVIPDYHAFQANSWVIFPHEIRETIDELTAKWAKPTEERAGLSIKEIKERFLTIGLPTDEVDYYLNKI